MVGISVIERLLDFFGCDVAALIVYAPQPPAEAVEPVE
jgi:hypothetical protein